MTDKKICSKCKEEKSLDEFTRYGKGVWCKKCNNEYMRNYYRDFGSKGTTIKKELKSAPDGQKHCAKCGNVKYKSEFTIVVSTWDGLSPWCKTCQHEKYVNGKHDVTMPIVVEKFCAKCGHSLPASDFCKNKANRVGLSTYCKKHLSEYNKELERSKPDYIPMSENRYCAEFLGCHVNETILSKVFKDVKVMPYANPGYDFLCIKNKKIDCKSATLSHSKSENGEDFWNFHIRHNVIADYFLLVGYDNREDLNPLRCWIIPGNLLNNKETFAIRINDVKWNEYERKIDEVVDKCDLMKSGVSQ